jgi:hypothetical protein
MISVTVWFGKGSGVVSGFKRRVDQFGLGQGLALLVVMLGATVSVVSMRSSFLRAWAPLLVLGWYWALVVCVNRSWLEIEGGAVRFRRGPLPTGVWDKSFSRAEIRRLYVRSYLDPGRWGGYYKAIGIETASGIAIELEREELPAMTIGQRAEEMARTLGWTEPVAELDGALPGRDVVAWWERAPFFVWLLGGWWWVMVVFAHE